MDATLNLPGYDEVFCIGDMAACKDAAGQSVPGVAPAAMQQGRFVAAQIDRRLQGGTSNSSVTWTKESGDDRPQCRRGRVRQAPRVWLPGTGSCGSPCTFASWSASATASSCCYSGCGTTYRVEAEHASSRVRTRTCGSPPNRADSPARFPSSRSLSRREKKLRQAPANPASMLCKPLPRCPTKRQHRHRARGPAERRA